MKKINLTVTLMTCLYFGTPVNAVQYDGYEINQQLQQTELIQLSTDYLQNYFSSQQPAVVIEELLQSDLTALKREYILFNILTEISQQPPQAFHQSFVDRMKTYAIEATRVADEGHLPVAIFHLNSKAHGIENIWTAYRTEQRFNQLFEKDMPQALADIQVILAQDSKQRRPQWLGVKNSIAVLANRSLHDLADYLYDAVQTNDGLDPLISHVGLFTARIELIEKALSSDQPGVRELTLRQLAGHLAPPQAKSLLLEHAQAGLDRKFSTSLLSPFSSDKEVESFLIEQLNNKTTAANAAFALSQSDSLNLPTALKKRYLLSDQETEKNHLLLALKLNPSSSAKLALDDLLSHIKKESSADRWLKSFEHNTGGEQP